MADPDARVLTEHFLGGLRIATAAIAMVVLAGLALPSQLTAPRFHPISVAGLIVLLGIAAAGVVLAVRGRSWGRARWPAAVAALSIASVEAVALPASALVGGEQQMVAVVGWIWVMLFIDVGMVALVGFIAAHLAVIVALLGAADRFDRPTVVQFLLVTTAFVGFQLALGAAAGALRTVAANAAAAANRHSELVTAGAVARHLHADRALRYDSLRATALPLLRGLADGTAPARDPEVQRRAAQEAARMRRLFAEHDEVADPFLNELMAVVDVAERRGLIVQRALLGRRPTPPQSVRRVLLDEVSGVLLRAEGSARVTVAGNTEVLTVGVVADAPGVRAGERRVGDVQMVSVVEGKQTWTQARWTVPDRAS